MKMYLLSLLAILLNISCSNGNEPEPEEPVVGGKALVVYFSRSGNTRTVANQIRQLVGGDIVEIETVAPYPSDYNAVLTQAQNELNTNFHPALKTTVEDIGKYDVIIVGHPVWHGHVPPPVQSFLAAYDLSGKKIAPFCTHGGSGVAQSRSDISRLCPNATLLESLAISGSSAGNATGSVTGWLQKIGIIKNK
ncbi:MAG: hypothetical protein EZS26_003446 [Candidatus Ordinivivax streblomastigis]|uniref:Flavodoxin-like domain-containing protein n=1 Tax=Candidatus Ordinivivax streblomastigis TaxID=2540710 RepID=A0A5M8NUX1_9BACT|nr:MAG: hypothetical protein EZS26_003446 [Candidatus Ordinivivax streblomastigis]